MTPRPARGFTLVEMLVALVVFGLLSAATVGVLVHAADNREVVGARMDRLGEFQRARALIKADLGQAAPRRVRRGDGSAARTAFIGQRPGDAPLWGFVRRGWSNPDGAARASMQYVEYRIAGRQLERTAHAALDGARAPTPQVVLTGVEATAIGYRYRGQWNDGWPGGADEIPEAIRLTLEVDGLGTIEQLFLLPGGGA
ncbi:MAG: type II secretion system protein GspJ [Lysobacterales bacterium RIFOXYD1_FULL_69_11]|nr:MAG: type II secretion system protein GspJ [Xanthomonadales bacterium RIFOXYA1_FULL_69_10]OHE86329.1 MAG: type II secretion system protein GspJ [Xanthomonadales bacterium RIFOXYD1_FULL_69_11]